MRVLFICLSLLFSMPLLLFAAAQDEAVTEVLIELDQRALQFGSPDTFSKPVLSPSGRYIAVLEWNGEAQVVIYDYDDPDAPERTISFYGEKRGDKTLRHDQYNSLRWLTDSKLFLDLSVRRAFHKCRGDDCRYYMTRVLKVLDLETKQLTTPFKKEFPNYFRRPNGSAVRPQANVVNWPESASGPALLSLYKSNRGVAGNPSIYEINRETLELDRVHDPKKWVYRWAADLNGQIRYGWESRRNGDTFVHYRPEDSQMWERIKQPEYEAGQTFELLAFAPGNGQFFALSNHKGGPDALYLYDLLNEAFIEKLYSHERYDVTGINLDDQGELASVFAGEVYVPIKEPDQEALDAVEVLEPAGDRFVFWSRDYSDNRQIIEFKGANAPGTFYLYDKAEGRAWEIGERRKRNEDIEYGDKFDFVLEARDGLELDAYVALPAGLTPETADAIPFVIMPHGGPWARDFASYDDLTQFINSLGFGVLKVNFRGSDGYGAAFEEMGVGEWGGEMQADLNDAHNWAIQKGWADPERMCMVGWSYGGYASLMAAIQDTDKYRCVGSVAGVTDLFAIIRNTRNKEVLRRLGAKNRFDTSAARDVSPIKRVDEISVPVFLAHGDRDRTVPYQDHYSDMLRALRSANKDVDFVAFKGGDHSLTSYYDRQVLYDRLGSFLERHLLDSNQP